MRMIMLKSCEVCGKVIYVRSNWRKYCSKKCRLEAIQEKREREGQLCWRCKNACGNCSWSRNFEPVEGWKASPYIVKDSMGDIHTYEIVECPQFVRR